MGVKMLIAGVDEAGRGPVIGPMVFSVAVINEEDKNKLVSLGVTDSKMLSPEEREELFNELGSILLEHRTLSISAAEINEWMKSASLNEIEAIKTAELLNSLSCNPDICYVDCPDTVQERYARSIGNLSRKSTRIIAEHKADMNYRIVGAASILAKVTRDRAIRELSALHGELGSGYPGDPLTKKWIDEYWEKNRRFPDFVRKRWSTVSRKAQLRLNAF